MGKLTLYRRDIQGRPTSSRLRLESTQTARLRLPRKNWQLAASLGRHSGTLCRTSCGTALIEYVLLLSLIAIVSLGAISLLGEAAKLGFALPTLAMETGGGSTSAMSGDQTSGIPVGP